jgi:osmotically-inducible protein OsmY
LKNITRVLAGIFAVCCLSGCDGQQQAFIENKAGEAASAVKDAAQKTATDTLRDTTDNALKTLTKTAANTRQGGVALRVKTALALSSRLEGSRIDVELQGNSIVLKGEALTVEQKSVAGTLAKNIADAKFRIDNQLKVTRPASPSSTPTISSTALPKGY